jgi:uncharacterized protein
MLQHFWDEAEGNLFFTSDDHEQLIARTKNLYDLAIPSGNSMAASNLIKLHHYTQNNSYLDRAARIMKSGARTAAENPFGFGQMLNAIYFHIKTPVEVTVIVTGGNSNIDNSELAAWLNGQFLPHGVNAVVSRSELAQLQNYPYFKGRAAQGDGELAFVCKNFSCSLPIKSSTELERQLRLS